MSLRTHPGERAAPAALLAAELLMAERREAAASAGGFLLRERPNWEVEADEAAAWLDRQVVEGMDRRDRAGCSGLVSVPTSGKRTVGAPFAVLAAAQAAAQAVGAFAVDRVRGRISRLRRTIGVAARCHLAVVPQLWRTVMVTLTYRGGADAWEARHISDFLMHARKWCQRQKITFRYVWVAELQKRGVIHYHVAFWLPPGLDMPKPDEAGWWPHGWSRIETARAAVAYLMHYLKKQEDAQRGQLPKGARSHGRGGLGEDGRGILRWLSYPAFVQQRASVSDVWRRAPGGGWRSPDAQEDRRAVVRASVAGGVLAAVQTVRDVWPSEFRRVAVAGGFALQRVFTYIAGPDCIKADGPYSRLAFASETGG